MAWITHKSSLCKSFCLLYFSFKCFPRNSSWYFSFSIAKTVAVGILRRKLFTNLKFLWQSVRSTAETFYRTQYIVQKERVDAKMSHVAKHFSVTWNRLVAVMNWLLLCVVFRYNSRILSLWLSSFKRSNTFCSRSAISKADDYLLLVLQSY